VLKVCGADAVETPDQLALEELSRSASVDA
jgi:hypothetical protein